MSNAISVSDLTVSYDKKPVLWGIDFSVPVGSMVGVVGPNGSGKSTMLKAIMGILPLNAGRVEIFGSVAKRVRKRVGYVPQREAVDWDFPITVREVVLMGRYGKIGLIKRPGREDYDMVNYCLQRVDMLPFADRQIGDLSGGQQQRVFLARALAQESDLYLMDEPFAGVDATTENAIIELMKELREQGRTLVVVHHDLSTVQQYFDRLLLLNKRLIAYGETEEIMTKELLQKTYGGKLHFFSTLEQQEKNT